MARRTLELHFPSAGVVRRWGLRASSNGRGPYPSVWAVNTRLEDGLTKRLRGGSFTACLEDGYFTRDQTLTTEDDDTVTTEAGDDIVFETQPNVVTGHGQTWVNPGADAPTRGPADCLYRGRLLRVSDNAILASRMGDTTDWDYGADLEDVGRATAFQLSEHGLVGDDVLALIPHQDSFLLCLTEDSVWVLAGDPVTGTLRNVSREVGIVASSAWCKNDAMVYFLGTDGLYAIGADGSGLKAVSEDKIPEELQCVDDSYVKLTYNHDDGGVYIDLSDISWFYDTRRDQFWPYTVATPNSHVLIGPLAIGGPNHFGRVVSLNGITAIGSADVTWHLVPGDTAEAAAANGKAAITAALAGTSYAAYVHSSGTWTAGRSHMSYPRTRAVWVVLWLSSTGEWAYEGASMVADTSGMWR